MVRRILYFLNKKTDGVHEAAYLLAVFAIVSQLLALFRDRTLAAYFGAGPVLDIYYAAFRIPDIIFAVVASAVSISVLIPFLSNLVEGDKSDAKKFINSIFSLFFLVITLLSMVLAIFMPSIIRFFFGGLSDPESFAHLVLLSRIMLLSPILLGVSNLLASLTQLFNNFFVYALSPILYNFGIIIGATLLFPMFGIKGLAMGVVLGALLHLMIQIPVVAHYGFLPRFTRLWDWQRLKKVILTSMPRTLTLSSHQISLLFLVSLASTMTAGSITVFNFSMNLQSVPLTIIGVSYSLAAFPTLAKYFNQNNTDEFFREISLALKHIIFWSVPAIVLFIVLRAQVVRTVLGAGEFGWGETRLTAAALAIFIFSAAAQSLVLLFVRGYYAAGNTAKPLIFNISSSVLIVILAYVLNYIFIKFEFLRYFIESLLKVSDLPGSNILALPLAYSIGMFLNVAAFWIMFQLDFKKFDSLIYKSILHTTLSSVFMGFVIFLSLRFFALFLNLETLIGIFLQGFFSGVVGIVFGILLLVLLKNDEIKEVSEILHKKIWKTKIIVPTPEEL